MTSKVAHAFERSGGFLLFAIGAAMVLLAVVMEDRDGVATALVGLGAALMLLAVLLPRLTGSLKFGPQGFEAELVAAVEKQAEQRGLSPRATKEAVEEARTDTENAWAAWMKELTSDEAGDPGAGRELDRQAIRNLARQYVERS